MKKLLIALAILSLTANVVRADQYGDDGGDVKGEQVSEQPKHEDVQAGVGDMTLAGAMALLGSSSAISTILYKATRKLYIFDR